MAELTKVGTFCPNPACPDYEQVQESQQFPDTTTIYAC